MLYQFFFYINMNILIDSYLYLYFFLFAQEIQSLPLVKSTHECTQDISKQGILHSSVCEEHHVLRPFSRESSGAVTTTRQSLKYVNTVRTAHSTPGKLVVVFFQYLYIYNNHFISYMSFRYILKKNSEKPTFKLITISSTRQSSFI